MSVDVEHFDHTGRNVVVIGNTTPVVESLHYAYEEAGALITAIDCDADEVATRLPEVIAAHGSLDVLVTAFDVFLAKPVTEVTTEDLSQVYLGNCASVFTAAQLALAAMDEQHHGGRIIAVTQALGQRGLPNVSLYAAAHGAVQNMVRALAQEVARREITVNGIALGWMNWMSDRLDPEDPDAARAVRFAIAKQAGKPEDVGAMAVWLSGTGAGFVTGQILPVDGGLTQHL